MTKKPFFSIAIPTYNRPQDLKAAIKSFLVQDFTDFEIIISDNSASDKSEKICKSFKDKRIKYSRNKTNIGFARNLYKVIKRSSGKYVFLFGNDDLMFQRDSLDKITRVLEKSQYGYYRLKFIFHHNLDYIFDFNQKEINRKLEKGSSSLKTLEFIFNASYSFISGNIFLNTKDFFIPEIEASTDPDFQMECFWIKFIYPQVQRYGAYYDTENIILVKWVIEEKNWRGGSGNTPGLYDVLDNKIYIEKSWDLIFEYLNSSERKNWIHTQLGKMIPILPSIKYYSSNKNLLVYIRRILELDNKLIYKPSLYLFSAIALLMPKFLWNKLRGIVQDAHIIRAKEINRDLQILKKIISL